MHENIEGFITLIFTLLPRRIYLCDYSNREQCPSVLHACKKLACQIRFKKANGKGLSNTCEKEVRTGIGDTAL